MGEIIPREWNGKTIRQAPDGYFDGTAMADSEEAQINDWLRLKKTKALLAFISGKTGIPVLDLVKTKQGGGGDRATWVHQKVAIALAAWCSTPFQYQTIEWVEELLTTGKVELGLKEQPGAAPNRRLSSAEKMPILADAVRRVVDAGLLVREKLGGGKSEAELREIPEYQVMLSAYARFKKEIDGPKPRLAGKAAKAPVAEAAGAPAAKAAGAETAGAETTGAAAAGPPDPGLDLSHPEIRQDEGFDKPPAPNSQYAQFKATNDLLNVDGIWATMTKGVTAGGEPLTKGHRSHAKSLLHRAWAAQEAANGTDRAPPTRIGRLGYREKAWREEDRLFVLRVFSEYVKRKKAEMATEAGQAAAETGDKRHVPASETVIVDGIPTADREALRRMTQEHERGRGASGC